MPPQFTGRDTPSLVISFAQKTLKDGQIISKLHVIELGGAAGESALGKQQGATRAGPGTGCVLGARVGAADTDNGVRCLHCSWRRH